MKCFVLPKFKEKSPILTILMTSENQALSRIKTSNVNFTPDNPSGPAALGIYPGVKPPFSVFIPYFIYKSFPTSRKPNIDTKFE